MSNLRQEILYPGSGLNSDNSNLFMPMGDAPYRLHIMNGEDGQNGIVENMKGNHVAVYDDLNYSRAYQVIGSHYDRLSRKCYFWVFSMPYDSTSSGDYVYDNRLLVFDENTELISLVFLDDKNYFGLDLAYPVKDCDMLGDWLYFNPRISEPKMIDVVRAANYTNYDKYDALSEYVLGNSVRYFGGVFTANAAVIAGQTPCTNPELWDRIGDCYEFSSDIGFDSEFRYAFNEIKHIPVYSPSCSYGSDATRSSNNVQGKVFRFTHRYKYFDNSYSKWSLYSGITLPQNGEKYDGEIEDATITNNYIAVQVQLHSPALVKEIDIVFQEIGEASWRRAKIVNRQEQATLDDTVYTYNFYNTDASYEVVDSELFSEVYDSVPRWAATQELINKNTLTYSGVTEGFDNIPKDEIDVTLTPVLIPISQTPSISATLWNNVSSGDITESIIEDEFDPANYNYYRITIDLTSAFGAGLAAGNVYHITLNGVSQTYTLAAGDIVNVDTLADTLAVFLGNFYLGSQSGIAFGGIGGNLIIEQLYTYPSVTQSYFYSSLANEITVTKHRGFKTGAWHPTCLFYFDAALRRCDAQTSKDNIAGGGYSINGTTVYVPMFGETSPTPESTANKWNIEWEVNHTPPDYAKWWCWGYAGNALCSWFVQYTVSAIADADPWATIDITPLQTLKTTTTATWNQFPQSNIDPYQWVKGDRVRFITETPAATDLGDVVEGIYDFEIVKFDEDTNLLYVQLFDFATPAFGENTLVEIYRPRKTDVHTVFYEFGGLYPVKEDSSGRKVHGGNNQDQDLDLSLPATGTFSAGDVYHIARTPSKPIDPVNTTEMYFHESQWYSDFYDSDDWDRGRPGVETWFNERTLNIIRFSNQYLQNTGINGLSTFEADNYKELNDIYGSIVGSVEVGTTLKVYMEKKSASILIGRQEYVDSAGQTTLATSERVLGSVRYPENNFGTQWIESLSKNNKFVYGFDVYNGVLWRDSVNGIFPVSGRYEDAYGNGDYKMETYFREKAEALLRSGIDHVTVMTVWDERYKCLYVIFRDLVNSVNDETIVFHEPSNRWVTFADFTQTPAEGYSVMLELDYWVLRGFELGIGFDFDEDTRFAIFNIVTGSSNRVYPAQQGLTFSTFTPTVTCDGTPTPSLSGINVTPITPLGVVTYAHLLVGSMNWTAAEYGWANKYGTQVNCSPNPCILSDIPSWITAARVSGAEISEGDTISNGETIYFYPTVANVDAARSNTAEVANSNSGYTDTDTILLTQEAPIVAPSVIVYVDGDNPSYTSLSGLSGSLGAGESVPSITFTIADTRYGATVQVHWRTQRTDGYAEESGWLTATNNATQTDNTSIVLVNAVSSGETLSIFLRGVIADDETVTPTLQGLTLSTFAPSIISSACLADTSGVTFAATDDTFAEGQVVTITASGDPPDPTMNVEIDSMPSWVTIWHGDLMTGYALYEGDTIEDQETVTVFPSSQNIEYIGRSGYIVLTNNYGETVTLTVAQSEASPPGGETPIATTIAIYAYDYYLTIPVGYYSASGMSNSNLITYSFVISHALLADEETFTLYWRADRTTGGVTATDSFGSFEAVNSTDPTGNPHGNNGQLALSSTLIAGDSVTLYFSSSSF